MAEVRLRPERPEADDRSHLSLALLLLVVGAILLLRPVWAPEAPKGLLITVTGQVAFPGEHLVDPPTLSAAVEQAGGRVQGVPDSPLFRGDSVYVGGDGARVVPRSDPLLVALPVDVNRHDAGALVGVPGMSQELADAIVAGRLAGPYLHLDDLRRVRGISSSRLEDFEPFLTLGNTEVLRIDLNQATPESLELLPGVGEVLARRIVEHRQARGRFERVDDLAMVSGVGPALISRVRDRLVVR